jgi:hypothetical protein
MRTLFKIFLAEQREGEGEGERERERENEKFSITITGLEEAAWESDSP